MLFSLNELSSDPIGFLTRILLYIPGMLLAISIHESAHGWVAEKCGDPTARYAGRITLNPIKHFDPMGFLCMLLIGFGWAKPVPVNPLLYKNYRKDDIKVSLAGITANLCLFLICFIITQALFTGALAKTPEFDFTKNLNVETSEKIENGEEAYLLNYSDSEKYLISYGSFWDGETLYKHSAGLTRWIIPVSEDETVTVGAADIVIRPAFGKVVAILYQMLSYCMVINLSLAIFNLIPLPPLDGYHVLNDLVLHQDLFAQRRTQQITSMVLLALIMLGNVNSDWDLIGKAISWVWEGITGGLGSLVYLLSHSMGII